MKGVLICFLFLILVGFGSAATINALSCEQTDVQNAINLADYGDSVLIPAGNCVWINGTTIIKDIKILGAGIDKTNLTLGFANNNIEEAIFKFVPDVTARNNLDLLSDTNTFEVSGISFIGSRMKNKFGIWIYNRNFPVIKRIKIYNNKFISIHRAVQVIGYTHGVFYDNNLIDTGGSYPQGAGWPGFVDDKMELGSGAGWYIEDNTFSFFNSVDSGICGAGNSGGGYVVRYNDVLGSLSNGASYVETHGNQKNGIYGPQITEVYGNDMIASVGRITNARGGKNIYLNNIFAASGMQIWEEYSDLVTSQTNPPGRCAENQGISRQTCAEDCICQKVHDSYFINNRGTTGTIWTAIVTMDFESREDPIILNNPPELVENIEFFNYVETNFNGTSGVGCGTLLNRPVNCTVGVGYWATNQSCDEVSDVNVGANPIEPISGTLYKCTAPNTWTAFYIPYTYPHPLRDEETPTPTCGNNIVESGEICDGIDLNDQNCSTVNASFVSGDLSCLADCSGYDVSGCVVGEIECDVVWDDVLDKIADWKAYKCSVKDVIVLIREWVAGGKCE